MLQTDSGPVYRNVRAGSGYLSGDPARIHFGLPVDAQPLHLEIRWPDGVVSRIDDVTAQSLLTIQRS